MTAPRKKQGHGPIPTYETRAKEYAGEFAWLTAPDPAARRYVSSLSRPGRYCKACRTFVAGSRTAQCRSCWTTA